MLDSACEPVLTLNEPGILNRLRGDQISVGIPILIRALFPQSRPFLPLPLVLVLLNLTLYGFAR